MKKYPLTISIPTPCHESWEAMSPADKGRFCQSCQKIVTDFSNMDDQQILSYLKNKQGEVCGRFHTGQLNREICAPANTRRNALVSIAAMITALTIAIPSVQAKSKAATIQMTPEAPDDMPLQTDTIPTLKGIAINKADGSPVIGATVLVRGLNIRVITDTAGKFELQVPQGYNRRYITLAIFIERFNTGEFNIRVRKIKDYQVFSLKAIKVREQPEGVLTGGIAVASHREATFWERFKYRTRQLFH